MNLFLCIVALPSKPTVPNMKKVYLQFRSKAEMLNFLEQINNPLCVVDTEKNRIFCQLSEEDIEYAQKKYKASLLPGNA